MLDLSFQFFCAVPHHSVNPMTTSEISHSEPLNPLSKQTESVQNSSLQGSNSQVKLSNDRPVDPAHVHPHVHSEESLRRVVNRLSRIEGHIRGIKMMVQESRACPDVLIQLAAVRGALDRVSRMILDEHLTECVARAAREGKIEEEIEELKAALDRFLP